MELLDWEFDNGLQIYNNGDPLLQDWLETPADCPICFRHWRVVTAVCAKGFVCPFCGHVILDHRWSVPPDAQDNRKRKTH